MSTPLVLHGVPLESDASAPREPLCWPYTSSLYPASVVMPRDAPVSRPPVAATVPKRPGYVLLRVERPTWVVVRQNDVGSFGIPYAELPGHLRYFYDEHTCPTNWTRDIEAFVQDGNDDPHGVASFVRFVETDEAEPDLRAMFPEAFEP